MTKYFLKTQISEVRVCLEGTVCHGRESRDEAGGPVAGHIVHGVMNLVKMKTGSRRIFFFLFSPAPQYMEHHCHIEGGSSPKVAQS